MNVKNEIIILGSASPSRAAVLKNAGVAFRVDPPELDERPIREKLQAEGLHPAAIGMELAKEKARIVSLRPSNKGLYVIGADQILVCEGKMYGKPVDVKMAAEHLKSLKGQTHTLLSSVAIYRDGECLHTLTDKARLTIRNFTKEFLDDYLKHAGEGALTSVGAYQLEGIGALLFRKIDGDFFTILGLPLIALLRFFREQGVLPK
jgi:nucleoside triphosphate pyrophosphatase